MPALPHSLVVVQKKFQRQFGLRLRQLREERALTQERLAELADFDRTYLSGIERGVRNPTLAVIGRLAKALGITPAELLGEVAL